MQEDIMEAHIGIGRIAYSKAGHDKGQLYVIIGEDDKYVYLADGNLKKIEHPKRKSKKHIQIWNRIDYDILEKSQEGCLTDIDIRKTIKVMKPEC